MGRCKHNHCCVMVPATIFSNQSTFAYAGVTFYTNRVNCYLADQEVSEPVPVAQSVEKAVMMKRSKK